jgi:hypothetical protein
MTRKLRCLFVVLVATLFAACTHSTIVSYQPLGDFQSWGPFGITPSKAGGDATGTYHLYMLRGIANPQDAAVFAFDINRVSTVNNDNVQKGTSLMLAAPPEFFLAPNFTKTVTSGSSHEELPGGGVFFVVFSTGDVPGDTPRHLRYTPMSDESVIMHMLDAQTSPEAGHLDDAFLNKLQAKAGDYKNAYLINGTKK